MTKFRFAGSGGASASLVETYLVASGSSSSSSIDWLWGREAPPSESSSAPTSSSWPWAASNWLQGSIRGQKTEQRGSDEEHLEKAPPRKIPLRLEDQKGIMIG